jgi:Electron transfer flavoprotein-ubiquinone oxidoreductase, 4Fe-4S
MPQRVSRRGRRLQVGTANCVHCKACDIFELEYIDASLGAARELEQLLCHCRLIRRRLDRIDFRSNRPDSGCARGAAFRPTRIHKPDRRTLLLRSRNRSAVEHSGARPGALGCAWVRAV